MDLNEATQLVEELEDMEREPVGPGPEEMPEPEAADAELPPSEPPISDQAVGADSAGNVALELLAAIKDLLAQLLQAEGGEHAGEEGEEDLENEESEGEAVDAIPEPPNDEDEEEVTPSDRPAHIE